MIVAVRREPLFPSEVKREFLQTLAGGHFAPSGLIQFTERIAYETWRSVDHEFNAAAREGVGLVNIFSPCFPNRLRDTASPPPLLFYRGTLPPPDIFTVAIVGSRRATRYGDECAYQLAERLTALGAAVLSGLAVGIDSAAHRGAVAAANRAANLTSGCAVLGSGVCSIYPRENEKLAANLISTRGALLSEYGVYTPPQKYYFPERNRIVAAAAELLIVVEAGERSGSLITARLAAESGRDVFVIPGPVTSKYSVGTNQLIRDGAAPIVSIDSFIDELLTRYPSRLARPKQSWPPHLDGAGEGSSHHQVTKPTDPLMLKILSYLELHDRCHFDEIIDAMAVPAPQTIAAIQQLEIFGNLTILPGSFCTTSPFVME